MTRIPGKWPTDWSGPALQPPPPPPDRSKLNLTLFAILMVGVTVWFSLHLQPWLGEVLVVVGPLTVWALWKLLQSWLNWGGLGPRAEAGTRKLLARPAATEPLIVALGAMGLLFLTTSSIYLVYDGAGKGEEALEVSVLAEGGPFLDAPLRVTSARRTAGRPFFGRFSSEDLQFVVDSPLYEPRDVRFWPWQPLRLEVPSGFEKKSFHLLLLAPGIRLLSLLPAEGQTQARRFYLRIETGGSQAARIDDLKQQTVLTGAPPADLDRLSAGQPDERARAALDRYLAELEVPAQARESFQNAWSRVEKAPSPRLREDDKIKILVGCEGHEPLYERDVDVGAAGTQLHIIEVDRDGC